MLVLKQDPKIMSVLAQYQVTATWSLLDLRLGYANSMTSCSKDAIGLRILK